MLHYLEFILHQIQSINALLESLRELREQRRHLGVFEVLELRDYVIAFFPSFHPIHETLDPLTPQAIMVDTLRKHSRVKQRKVANVLADLAFAIKRGRWTVDRVRLDQHLAHIVQRLPRRIAD